MKRTTMVCLNEILVGERCRIVYVHESGSVSRRMMALGLLPNVSITVVGVAPLGDPMTIEFGFSRLSIRKSDAKLIEVRNEDI